MKILITVGIYPPDIGGPASFVPKIAKLLANNNHEVTVICLSDKKLQDKEIYSVNRIIRKQNLILRWTKTVLAIIKGGLKADIIFVNGLPMEAYVANIFLRKKVVRKIVGDWAWERGRNRGLIEDSFDEFQLNSHNLHLEIAKFSRGWTATKADLVITPSLHLKNVVKGWGVNEGNIKVIYNGTRISTKVDNRNRFKDEINFITVGRLAPWKNIDVMIKSMSILKDTHQNIKLYIVGSGPQEKKLKELTYKLNLTEEVIFTGQKTLSELEIYYENSDIYIQGSGYEGLPHVLLEALNYQLSIISTPIGGSNEILKNGENGWILELVDGIKPDSHELVKIIKEVLNDDKSRIEKIEQGSKILRSKFDEEKNLNEYLKVLKNE